MGDGAAGRSDKVWVLRQKSVTPTSGDRMDEAIKMEETARWHWWQAAEPKRLGWGDLIVYWVVKLTTDDKCLS